MSAIIPAQPAIAVARWRYAVLLLAALAAAVAMLSQDPIPQPVAFHRFADARLLGSVPNFWNVVTNLVFLGVGLYGLLAYRRCRNALDPQLRPAYLTVLIGSVLICFGSGWYHLAPDTPRLTWDRLPIALTFVGVFSAVVGEYLRPDWGRRLLAPLLTASVASVAYWDYSETLGQGDLRYYALVQIIPILLVPLILLLFRPGRLHAPYLWGMVGIYVLAKVFETFDIEMLNATGMSGHSWKHLAAGLGVYLFVLAMKRKSLHLKQKKI